MLTAPKKFGDQFQNATPADGTLQKWRRRLAIRVRWPTCLDVTEVDEFRLLRARREGPSRRRAAECRDELPPPHVALPQSFDHVTRLKHSTAAIASVGDASKTAHMSALGH